jgi:hypothetical protein
VVCGHIHHPEIRDIDGVTYFNDGDWVESLSALVEHVDGRFELIAWPRIVPLAPSPQVSLPAPTGLPQPMPMPQPATRDSTPASMDVSGHR